MKEQSKDSAPVKRVLAVAHPVGEAANAGLPPGVLYFRGEKDCICAPYGRVEIVPLSMEVYWQEYTRAENCPALVSARKFVTEQEALNEGLHTKFGRPVEYTIPNCMRTAAVLVLVRKPTRVKARAPFTIRIDGELYALATFTFEKGTFYRNRNAIGALKRKRKHMNAHRYVLAVRKENNTYRPALTFTIPRLRVKVSGGKPVRNTRKFIKAADELQEGMKNG